MNTLKRFLPDVLIVLLFAVISFAYFYPADTEGRILYRHDSSAGRGLGHEAEEFSQRTGETTRWTNAAFSGMPTYQSAPSYESTGSIKQVINAYHLWLPENVWYVFAYLLGFYILLRAFDFRWYLASLGAIVWAFSSYFFIIIAAGHIWKVMALAYLPPLMAGIFLAYRGKYLAGLAVTGIFTAFEILANHVQMTYYYFFIIGFLVIGFFVDAIRKKQLMHFVKASLVCLIGGILGVLVNVSNLYHTWQYQNESMRGKSELVKTNTANQTSSGLERDYITQWSYGIDETWTLLVPNTKGGSSMTAISQCAAAREKGDPMYMEIYQQMGQYWGEQPGTSGPVYVGAFVLMLFILGLFIVKGSIKWAMLAATILSIMLSWGHNLMWFTDLFIDYFPMYAKFRTVASILVIAEFTIPFLGMLALKKVIDEPSCLNTTIKGKKINWLYVSFALTGGICALFAIMPTVFFDSFVSQAELRALSGIPQEQLQPLLSNLTSIRIATFTADCWRSFFIIAVCTALVIAYKMKKLNAMVTVGIIAVICLFDMWQVNKRYLNDDMFVSNTLRTAPIEPSETDQIIIQDESLDYRVLNLASNTFNENETSYFHKSIGGYHAAKLRRYQELIERHISPEMQHGFSAIAQAQGDMQQVNGDSVMPVINMLNTKYLILPLQGGKTTPILNPYAMGNAWYVSDIQYVENANQEIDAVGQINLRNTAVADKKFESILGKTAVQDSSSSVTMTAYEPNELHYDVNSSAGGIVVFSEIYYPGWTATIDGKATELGRVNYVLRAVNVPAGAHKVVLEFKPTSIATTETIAYIALVLLVLSVIASIAMQYRKRKAIETK
ncbi:MAG: YfhO family protein [Prevotella sp.]|nr:YfhO family protein [Candidatus Prevotella equi]